MIEQPFILLIMNCKKYVKKAVYQKKTWLKQIPAWLKYYHVIGDEELDTEYKFDDDSLILWVKTPDDYNSLPKKVIAAYEAVDNTFLYQYIYKTDDDQILVKPQFFNIISNVVQNKTPKTHYGGFVVTIKENHLSNYHTVHPELPKRLPLNKTYYCSGRFYFLSKEAITCLISKKKNIRQEFFEDYAMGFYLDEELKRTIMQIATNQYFTDIELSDFKGI
jgi:hypothetical protein